MLLSHNIFNYLQKGYTYEQAVDILAEAGFDAIDFSFHHDECFNESSEEAQFRQYRAYAESKGLVFNQAHAPCPSGFVSAEDTEVRIRLILRSMELAAVLGVKIIVVHPMHHLPYREPGVPETLFQMNMAFYRRLLPYCEKYGIKIGIENMWQSRNGYITHSTCSTPEDMIRYLDTLNSPWAVGCLDIGHAMLVRQAPEQFIRALGRERLQGLHVHDVDGTSDLHTLPYYGSAGDFSQITAALKEIDYQGDLTFEAYRFLTGLPRQLLPAATKYMAEVGRYLVNQCR